jgi:hypothetical protein
VAIAGQAGGVACNTYKQEQAYINRCVHGTGCNQVNNVVKVFTGTPELDYKGRK